MRVFIIFISFLLALLISKPLTSNSQDIELLKEKAKTLRKKGIELSYEGYHQEALDTFKLFLEYRKQIYGEESPNLGTAYGNIGIAYKKLGRNDLALHNYKLAEKNLLLLNNPSLNSLGNLYTNIGNVYRAKLDYPNAISYFNRALAIYKNQDAPDEYSISNAEYSIAEINYLMGNYKKTLQLLPRDISLLDTLSQIYIENLRAGSHQLLKDYTNAEKAYLNSINLSKLYFGNEHIDLAFAYMNYANLLSEIGLFANAKQTLDKAYNIIHKIQPTRGIELSQYYENMGDLFEGKSIESHQIHIFKQQKRQNLHEAIKWYKKGLDALSLNNIPGSFQELKVENCLSLMDCLGLIKRIGDVQVELALTDKEDKTDFYTQSLSDALMYYQKTSEIIKRARQEITDDESKIKLAELEAESFSKTVKTYFLANEAESNDSYLEMAFNNAEQLKNSSVFDKIVDDLARENSLIPDSLIEEEKNLKNTISYYSEKVFQKNNNENSDSILIETYNEKIFTEKRKLEELNRLLETEYSDYYNLKFTNEVLSIHEIQKQMDAKEAIVEYILAENDSVSELFTIVITKGHTSFRMNTVSSELQNSLEYVFRFMSTSDYMFTKNEDSKQFCTASHNLYNLLIQPIENDIRNKNLVLIPDGKINYIAFDALLKTLPDTTQVIDFSKLDYLVKHYNINYANSANILFTNRNADRQIRNNTLAFAPEYNSEKFKLSEASYTLMPLPGVKKEVEAIASTIETKVFMGNDATEKNFRENAKNYDILHLAMHAYINDSLPAYSRLAFSPVTHTEEDISKDGWLNTADIYNLELNARLTVLSACNTGVGELKKGEGIMSLARGFLYAGCPSIVMSLWEVEDKAGTEIMTEFYKNLERGKAKDEALRLAKLNYLENSNSRLAHPHFWMSFRCIGDNTPIYTSYDIYFFGILIILILAFVIDQGIRISSRVNIE